LSKVEKFGHEPSQACNLLEFHLNFEDTNLNKSNRFNVWILKNIAVCRDLRKWKKFLLDSKF
jgi:ribonucleotide reductase beta subunit family protein with ferritin-like domain